MVGPQIEPNRTMNVCNEYTHQQWRIFALSQVPLEEKNRKCCDEGVPIVISEPNSLVSTAYVEIAQKVMEQIEEVERQKLLHPKIQL